MHQRSAETLTRCRSRMDTGNQKHTILKRTSEKAWPQRSIAVPRRKLRFNM